MREVYSDYNATTSLDPEVQEAMLPPLRGEFGNPSSIHPPGRRARRAIESAREQVVALINASDPSEIVFPSGATEANNTAILGATVFSDRESGHIIPLSIEHPSVLEVCKCWVDPESVLEALTDDTLIVSVMLANNETRSLQPVSEITRLVKSKRPDILVHTDAVQAIGKSPWMFKLWVWTCCRYQLTSFTVQKPLVLFLGQRGICVSVSSACSSGSLKPSHVLLAMGLSEMAAFSFLRFSWGKFNAGEEIDFAGEQIEEVVMLPREITLPKEFGVCNENCPCFFEEAGIA